MPIKVPDSIRILPAILFLIFVFYCISQISKTEQSNKIINPFAKPHQWTWDYAEKEMIILNKDGSIIEVKECNRECIDRIIKYLDSRTESEQ